MKSNDRGWDALSDIYHALRTPRRRHVIRFLSEYDEESISVRTLSRQIAALEEDVPLQYATGEPYRNVYNALSQTHLPTLSDVGLIIYDSDRQVVQKGQKFEIAVLLIALNRTTYDTLRNTDSLDLDY